MLGVPRTDIERLMNHYNISEEDAVQLLSTYSIDELLPGRGTGIIPVEIVGHTQRELASGLELMESGMNVGESAKVTLCTEGLPSQEQITRMYCNAIAGGHHITYPESKVIGGVPTIEFSIKKGSPALALIVPVIVPLLTIGLIAFGIVKIDSITKALLPILLITLGGIIVIGAIIRKPATKYLEQGGKVPLLPSTNVRKKALAVR